MSNRAGDCCRSSQGQGQNQEQRAGCGGEPGKETATDAPCRVQQQKHSGSQLDGEAVDPAAEEADADPDAEQRAAAHWLVAPQ
jgi:hypothetical protein